MFSERIKALAEYVDKSDTVIDIGCDHGYLSIYLKENNLCKNVYASDISANALDAAIKNFKKYNLDIKTYVSDGFLNIPVKVDTAVIAGMGTITILKIISHKKTPKKLILGSHNELYKLRKNLNEMGFKIVAEKAIFEKKHYYIILSCIKGKQRLTTNELKFGISYDKNYYTYLINKNKEIINKVPFKKKIKILYENIILKYLLEKSRTVGRR